PSSPSLTLASAGASAFAKVNARLKSDMKPSAPTSFVRWMRSVSKTRTLSCAWAPVAVRLDNSRRTKSRTDGEGESIKRIAYPTSTRSDAPYGLLTLTRPPPITPPAARALIICHQNAAAHALRLPGRSESQTNKAVEL